MSIRRPRPSTSIVALATVMVMGASPAAAQSLQGTGSFTFGSGTIATPDANTTNISITSPTAVIDWAPFDTAVGNFGAIGFQYAGTTATFSSTGNFAVLNRINPADSTRAISMDGTIRGLVGAAAPTQGGSIYFYSPSGFILGSNAVVNVGSLVLSALPITVDGNGNFVNGTTVQFGQAPNVNAAVSTVGPQGNSLGARINASNYVAMVAPTVNHAGAIVTGGQAALVAAEAATINFSPDGLFDISIDSGTTAPVAIGVSGSITGPAADGGNHRIYMVAIAKNQAMTMAIGNGADLGFDIAGAADVDGNAIVLSSGYNIVDGAADVSNPFVTGNLSNIQINGLTATSALTAHANHFIDVYSNVGQTSTYASNVSITAPTHTWVNASGVGASTTIAGNLFMDSSITGINPASVAIAGNAALYALNSASVSVSGDVTMIANGYGANNPVAGGAGGQGRGGVIQVQAGSGGNLTVSGALNVNADGYGGIGDSETGIGGIGRGGSVFIQSFNSLSSLTLDGGVTARADGYGGFGGIDACVLCTGVGGAGTGGSASISAGAGTNLSIDGAAALYTNGIGGDGTLSGGTGLGGGGTSSGTSGASVGSSGGTLALNSTLAVNATGTGGTGFTGNGGAGTGGRAFSGPTAGTMTVSGAATMNASGYGGGANGSGTGGTGRGGQSDNGGSGGTVNYGNINIFVDGSGGSSTSGAGGAGFGGQGWVEAFGAIVNVNGTYIGNATGSGGSGATGGLGDGGLILAAATGNDLTVTGGVQLYAQSFGGFGNGGNGGNALQGEARIEARNGHTVDIGGDAYVYSQAHGGDTFGATSAGGNATGGTARVFTSNGALSSVLIGGNAFIDASGYGGSGGEGPAFQGGVGTGGQALLLANAGVIDIDNSAYLRAGGFGGDGDGGPGGAGNGGSTYAFASSGSLSIGGGVESGLYMEARGFGGDSFDGTGGDGNGGFNTLEIDGAGSIAIDGTAIMNGSAEGGNGRVGGNATARITTTNELQPDAATVVVRGGGAITISQTLNLYGEATGGNGDYGPLGVAGGAGGAAVGGEIDVNTYVGTITTNGLNVWLNAYGGNGGAGGNGGSAAGGLFDITHGPFPGNAMNGTLTLGDVAVMADAFGGAGGNGLDGAVGGNGGAGGAVLAVANVDQFTASAAGGTLNAGTVEILGRGYGGAGGAGGTGTSGAGGAGGAGGTVEGRFVQTGSVSNSGSPSSGGTFTTADLSVDTSIVAGNGGAGGSGTTIGGDGGAGGDAGTTRTGSSFLGIRGIDATVGDVTLISNATGGAGGAAGSGGTTNGVAGVGGDAVGGRVSVESRERFSFPDQRGFLDAGAIYGEAIALAGTGSVNGLSTSGGASSFVLYNGDATIDSFEFRIQAATPSATGYDFIAVVDGTATINGAFTFDTTNPLSLYANRANTTLDQASLTATNINLAAADFIPLATNAVLGTQADPASNPGTFFATTFDIQTDNDFYTTANLDSVNFFEIIAPGSITANNIFGDDAVYLNAQSGFIQAGDIDAAQEIRLFGSTGITANDLTSEFYILANSGGTIGINDASSVDSTDLYGFGGVNFNSIDAGAGVTLQSGGASIAGGTVSAGGSIFGFADVDITLGNLDAVGGIELVAFGDILTGNAIAGEWIDLDTSGYVDPGGFIHTGNLTAGDTIEVHAGTNAELGNLSSGLVNPSTDPFAEYNIGILANDYIITGTIDSANHAGLASPGTISTGNVNVTNIFMVLGSGDMSFGSISAGQNLYLADFSMMALGGTLGSDGNFDPVPILNATPVATSGNMVIGGDVDAGIVQAAAGGDIDASNITAQTSMRLEAGGGIATGALDAGTRINLRAGGNIAIGGDTTAGGYVDIESYDGGITSLAITAGDSIGLLAGAGNIATGNLSAGIVNPIVGGEYFVGAYAAGGSLTTGNIDAAGDIALFADNAITGGDMDSGSRLLALAGGNILLGNVATSSTGQVQIGDISMIALGGTIGEDYDVDAVFVPLPTRSGGSVTLGTVSTGLLQVAAGGNLTTGIQFADDAAWLSSGGNILVNGDVFSGGSITILADGSITARDLYGPAGVLVDGDGAVTLRDIYAGIYGSPAQQEGVPPQKDIGPGAPVEIFSGTAITADDILTDGYVGLYSAGAITVDTIGAGHDIIALAGTDASFRAITTPEAFTLAGYGNFASLFSGQTFTPSLMFGIANPSSIGGDATFSGAVSAIQFRSYVGDATNLQGVSASQSIFARSGGMLTVGGQLVSPDITLVSGNIDIGANGRVNAGQNGTATLVSTGGDTVFGDGPTTTGYALSNTEFGRINGGLIRLVAGGFGADADTQVGDLTVTFGPSGNIRSADGGLEIATFDEAGVDFDGTLRVVGDVLASGLGPDNYVGFYTQNFELDAATGTIALTDAQGALGGTLELFANRIHVADGALLDQLAANPQFAGYVEALNAPATVQRPEGVIRAANFEIDFFDVGNDQPFSLLVQNTGSDDLPAGFLLTAADIGDLDGGEGSELPPGSVNLVINGQIVTPEGTLTGIDVRDLLVAEFGVDAFLAESTINGCLLTGSCNGGGTDGLPPSTNLSPPIIELVGNDPLGESPFGNEPDIDDSVPGDVDEQSSPIAPPQPLFDTTPLDPAVDTNDPVSGAGNPSLYSLPSDDEEEDEEERKKKPANKGGNK